MKAVRVAAPASPAAERWPESLLLSEQRWSLRVLELALKGLMNHDGPDEASGYLEPLYVLAYDVRRTAEEKREAG